MEQTSIESSGLIQFLCTSSRCAVIENPMNTNEFGSWRMAATSWHRRYLGNNVMLFSYWVNWSGMVWLKMAALPKPAVRSNNIYCIMWLGKTRPGRCGTHRRRQQKMMMVVMVCFHISIVITIIIIIIITILLSNHQYGKIIKKRFSIQIAQHYMWHR